MTIKKYANRLTYLQLIGLFTAFLSLSNAYAGSTLSAGYKHVCGIKADNTLVCWGNNEDNQATPPEGTFAQVSAGGNFNCALRTDGTLACWGEDIAGETSPPPGYYQQIETGGNHACALDENGVAQCWGANGSGQVTPSKPGPFQQLALGYNHSCGLKADGTIECWGNNSNGQTDVPSDTTFSSIVAGYESTCGIKTDGIATCWGDTNKSYGYLTQIDFAVGVSGYLCGLKVDKTLSCPSMDSVPSDVFNYVSINTNYRTSAPFACGIKIDGLVACWGSDHPAYSRTTPPKDENGDEIIFKHEVTPIPKLFTEAELNAKVNEARQVCITDPASCGIQINSTEELEQVREAGRQAGIASCQTNPASCGIVIPADVAASIGIDLSLHIYKIQYESLTGAAFLWADFIFGGQNENGELMWKLGDYGEVKE